MTNAGKNKDGGHTHPQKSHQNSNEQGDSRKSQSADDQGSDKK